MSEKVRRVLIQSFGRLQARKSIDGNQASSS